MSEPLRFEFHIRRYQAALYRYITTTPKARAMAVWHRRAGKDEILLAATRKLALQTVANYWHCLPEYEQARKALWNGVNRHTGKRRIDEAFPLEIRKRTRDQEMMIELVNGSTWQLIGSDRYDSLVGAGVAGVTFSEWSLCNPSAWGYIRPMIEESGGWAAFITTPRGRNHAYSMFQYAKAHPDKWFAELLSVNDTRALTPEQQEDARAELVSLFGPDIGNAQFEQEYLCNWNAAILGAFYAREMAAVRASGRVRDEVVPVSGLPIHTAWDLGVRDSTAIWWWQGVGRRLIVLDYYAAHGAGVDHYADVVQKRGWERGKATIDFVPHDARVQEWGSGKTRVEAMFELGLNPSVVPRSTDADGHQAIRQTLPHAVFNTRCEDGLSALEMYRREWDDDLKTFKAKALHDWASHGAKAFQYLAQAWVSLDPPAPPRPKPDFKPMPELSHDEFFAIEDDLRRQRDERI